MSDIFLTPEDLLTGMAMTFDVVVPADLLRPVRAGSSGNSDSVRKLEGDGPSPSQADRAAQSVVQIRPLTIGTFQLILKASKHDPGLLPLLMIKESLVQPTLSLEQTKQLPLGLVTFLLEQIRQVSGLTEKKSPSRS